MRVLGDITMYMQQIDSGRRRVQSITDWQGLVPVRFFDALVCLAQKPQLLFHNMPNLMLQTGG